MKSIRHEEDTRNKIENCRMREREKIDEYANEDKEAVNHGRIGSIQPPL